MGDIKDIINSLSGLASNKDTIALIKSFDEPVKQNDWLENWHHKEKREAVLNALGDENIKNLHNFLFTVSAMKLRTNVLRNHLDKKNVIQNGGKKKKARKVKS
jgi:hypothetical protein